MREGCDSHGNEPLAQTPPLCESKGPGAAPLDPRGPRAPGRNVHSSCLVFRESLISVRSSSPQKKCTWQHTKCLSFRCLLEAITGTPGDLQTPGGHSALACPHSGEGHRHRKDCSRARPTCPEMRFSLPEGSRRNAAGSSDHGMGPGEGRGAKNTQRTKAKKKKKSVTTACRLRK